MKKLFSYLLISSMVVLSSCTNYDDQFDDLNTQINALKSQIEGFSSLSTGLTALQGTVAGLQTAIAGIPETDLSGLESDLTDLADLVEALQAQVAATATALEAGAVSDAAVAAAIAVIQENQAALDTAVAAVTAAQATLATAVADAAAAQTADAAALSAAQTAADEAAVELAAAVLALQTDLTALGTTNEELKTVTGLIQAAVTLLTDGQAANTTSIASLVDTLADLDLETTELSELVKLLSTAVTTNTDEILASILAANSIYSTAISITDNASLDFAVALGDQLKVVNQTVTIVQSRDMDVTKLQSVMDKFISVVDGVSYTATATGITSIGTFTNLSSTKSLTLDVAGDISLPALTSVTNNLTIANNSKLTEISAPLLTKVGSFGFASEYTKVNSVDLSSLVRTPGAANASFNLRIDSGTVDLSSLITTTDATPAVERANATIEVDGATIVKAPLITSGTLLMDEVIEPNFPVWQGSSSSIFNKATKVVLPAITGGVDIDLNVFAPRATYFHMIGAEYNDPSSSTDDSLYPTFTTTGNTAIETLILDGSISSVTVSGASDLTTYTHTGKSHDVDFINNDSMSSVTFGYTTTLNTGAKGVAVTYGTLEVSGNAEITSVSAPELDDISKLDIFSNGELTTLSFPKLNSLGTDDDGTALVAGEANVNIYSNALAASNIQLPSLVGELPVVKGKITSTSGINALSTYIAAAIALKGTVATSQVTIDKVSTVTDKTGEAVTSGAIALPGTTAGSLSETNTQTWAGEDTAVNIVKLDAGDAGTPLVPAAKQISSYGITSSINDDGDYIVIEPNDTEIARVTFNAAFKAKYGITNTFVGTDVSTWSEAAAAELNEILDNGSYAFTVAIENDFGQTRDYILDMAFNGTLSDGNGFFNQPLTFTYGNVTLSAVIDNADTDAGMAADMVDALNASSSPLTPSYFFSVITGGIRVTPRVDGIQDSSANPTFSTFSFPADNYATAASLTSYLGHSSASNTINTTAVTTNKGSRITVINDSYTVKASLLDLASTASHTTASGVTFTELIDGGASGTISGVDNNLQRDWINATAGTPAGANTDVFAQNLVTWL